MMGYIGYTFENIIVQMVCFFNQNDHLNGIFFAIVIAANMVPQRVRANHLIICTAFVWKCSPKHDYEQC